MESEVVLGVVTGVLTSGLSGPWTAIDLNESAAIRFSMDLKQSAHALRGTCMMELYSTDNEFKVMLDVTGDLWEGYISLTLKPENRKISSYSVALLKVAGGGMALVGGHLFRNVNDEKVDDMIVSFVRGSGNRHHVIAFNEAAAKLQTAYANGPARPPELVMEHVFLLPRSLCISTVYRGRSPIPNNLNRRAPKGICVTSPLATGISVTSSARSLTGLEDRLRPQPFGSSVQSLSATFPDAALDSDSESC